jgi:hypothetical protein
MWSKQTSCYLINEIHNELTLVYVAERALCLWSIQRIPKINSKRLSINLEAIWNRIKVELKFGGHRNKILQEEWTNFGEENFRFEILYEIEQKEGDKLDYNKEAKKLEEMFIEELQPFAEKGYHAIKAQG